MKGDEVSEDVLNYNRALFNLHQKEEEVITAYQQVIKVANIYEGYYRLN